MVNRQLGQPVIRLCCLTRGVTIPGLVEEYSYYDSLHFWGKVWLTDSLDSLCCLTRGVTIPGLVEEYSYYDSLHFWGKELLTDSLDSLLYVCVAKLAELRYLDL